MKIQNLHVKFEHKNLMSPPYHTKCTVSTLDRAAAVGVGFAHCRSTDQFNKEIGRKLSLLRAMQNCGLNREERYQIWEGYRLMVEKGRWPKSTLDSRIFKQIKKKNKLQQMVSLNYNIKNYYW